MSFWQERYTADGFWQFREHYDNGGKSRWKFCIYSFSGEPGAEGTCRVRTRTGRQECRIDGKNRVLISGRWQSPLSWDH